MAYVQADLDNIRQCIASGILETRYADGRRVMYQSLADMLTAEQRIAASITPASGCRRRRRTPAYRDGN
jgi:hypothetical protein